MTAMLTLLLRARGALAALVALAVSAGALAQPALQLDPGAHWAPVRRIALSPKQDLVATSSDDKTVRIWNAATAKVVQVLRPPVGPGAQGRLYGVAFHPVEPLVAVGGTGGADRRRIIHLYQPLTGELIRTIDAGEGEVKRLVWSPDGRWLLACYATKGGLKAFSLDGREVFAAAFRGDCYGLDVSFGNMVAATDTSGLLHLFRLSADKGVEKLAEVPSPSPDPIAVSFSPDGQRLAVVHFAPAFNGVAQVLNAADGRLLQTLRPAGLGRGRTQAVAWSHDGRWLAVGGVQSDAATGSGRSAMESFRGFVQNFDAASGAVGSRVIVASDAVTDLAALADGRFAFTSFDSSWGVVDATQVLLRPDRLSDYVRRADRLEVSVDGLAVQWQVPSERTAWSFTLAERVLRKDGVKNVRAPEGPGMLSRTLDWESTENPKPTIQGRQFELAPGETSRAVVRIGRSDDLAWGTGHRLARVASAGRVVWSVAPGVETRAVNSSEDGRLVITAMADGTIRWFRASDGVLLLSLYALANGQWVAWSPSGHYDASPGAESIIGWLVNRPGSQGTDYFSIGRFRQQFFRPDVIDRLLVDVDETAAVSGADRVRNAAIDATPVPEPAAPVAPTTAFPVRPQAAMNIVDILPPTLSYRQARSVELNSGELTLRFGLAMAPGEQLKSIVVRRDGVIQAVQAASLPPRFDGQAVGSVTLQGIPEGDSVVHIVAENSHGFSDALSYLVHRDAARPVQPVLPVPAPAESPRVAPAPAPAPAVATVAKPRLFVLAIGVGTYADRDINPLDLPAKDATDFAGVLVRQRGRLYQDVVVRTLTDADATKESISTALRWFSGVVERGDYGMLFLAGHAVNHANGRYYFLSHNTSLQKLPATSIDEATLRAALVQLKGRAMLFVDTCHSGNAVGTMQGYSRDISKIANELASPENGVIVFASSTGRQESQQKASWGNGAFTKALVAGLAGGADLMRNGRITFQGLGYYVSSEVEKLTKGLQTPVMIVPPPGLQDFPLALSEIGKTGLSRGHTRLASALLRPDSTQVTFVALPPEGVFLP